MVANHILRSNIIKPFNKIVTVVTNDARVIVFSCNDDYDDVKNIKTAVYFLG